MIKTEKAAAIAKHYYYNVYGKDVTREDYQKTCKTIEYLFDCGFYSADIIKEVINKSRDKVITIKNVPDKFWAGSLIKRDAFYLHDELRITSKATEFNPVTGEFKIYPFYCEMKIRYTAEDVLRYFYSKIGSFGESIADKKTDLKTIFYLMKKYEKIDFVEPLDIILCLIDNRIRNENGKETTKLIQITDDSYDTIWNLQKDMQELEAMDKKRIVWRWENVQAN